ncbi:MAG: HIT domain-containing protein [Candidatus Omnitrophica bacterium]|nr:HIT domain-containing protein [Candidatus Omnitrophota bacterium]
MNMMWAPWREEYIQKAGKNKVACAFCRILKDKKDAKNYIFRRGTYAFAVLNIYPFNVGHALVVPYRHVADLADLTAEELAEVMSLVLAVKAQIQKTIKPDGFNIGINLGRAAGAGIPGHVHVHIVPRWAGDMNFMSVTGDVKVMPVSLKTVYERLLHAHKAGHRKARK